MLSNMKGLINELNHLPSVWLGIMIGAGLEIETYLKVYFSTREIICVVATLFKGNA